MSLVKSTLTINASPVPSPDIQFSRNSSATRLNNIGLVELVDANEIRVDYYPNDIGHIKGWLLEESSVNSLLQSTDFSTTWITGTATQTNNATVTTNSLRSPDGGTNSDTLSSSATGTGITAVRQQGLTYTNGQTYTVSVWAKKKGYTFLEISNKDDSTSGMTFSKVFNLATGALGSSGGTVDSSEIMEYPNGWYRCQVTFTADGNTDTEVYFKARSDDAVSTTYTITNGQGIYLWGAQSENKPYATSYIPTTTVSVTRAADVCFLANQWSKWNRDVGISLWVEGAHLNTTETVAPIYHYQDATNTNCVSLFSNAKYSVISDSTQQLDAAQYDAGFTSERHINFVNIIAVKPNRVHAALNGSLAPNFPDTSINLPLKSAGNDFLVKFFHGTGLNSGSGWLRGFKIYSNIPSDFDLQNVSLRGHQDAESIAVTAVQVLDGTISTQKLSDDAVTSIKILDGTIVTANIADGGVQTVNIGDDQVTQDKIAAGAVGGTEIANNSITSAHLGLDVIVAEDIANNAITFAELADNAVVNSKIAINAVDGSKIAMGSDAAGDVLYYNGTDYVRLPKGTSGQVLTQGAIAPSWAADSTDVDGTTVGGDLTGTVANAQIAANAVGSPEIAANAVGSTEIASGSVGITELDVTDGTSGQYLSTDGNGVLSFINDSTDVGGTSVGGDVSGTVSNIQIAADAVGTPEIADDAVTVDQLAANAVVTTSIVDLNVTTGKIANDAVTSDKLADDVSNDANRAVTTNHIKDLNITEGKLAAGAVTGTKLANNTITSAHIVDATITDSDLATNSVTQTKIAALAVNGSRIAANAITTSKIADNQVTIGKLALADGTAGQVLKTDGNGVMSFQDDTDTTIGDAAVGGDVSGTISNITIPAGAITSAMIGVDVIVAEDLAANSITVSELSNNAVSTVKILDNAVTGAKIAMGSDVAGDVLYYNGTDYVRLAKGTDGEVLTLASGLPSWDTDSTNVGGTALGGDLTGTVANAQIVINSVDGTHIALGSDAAGDVMYYNGTDYVRLAKGTAGQVLKINSGATAPEWAADIDTTIGDAVVGGDVTGTISNITIPNNTITSAMIAAGVIVAQDIALNAVNGTHIAMGSDIAGDVLYYNGTDYARLGAGTAGQVLTMNVGATAPEWTADSTNVGTTAVGGDVTGTVSNITIPVGSITSAMLGLDVIVAEDIANNAITVAELQDNAVITSKITDNAVTGAKIAMGSDAAGDVLYYNGTDYVRLPKGGAGEVLTINAGATAPEWAADSTNTSGTSVGGMMFGTVNNISISAGVVTPTMLSATGTADSTTFLRGDGQWAAVTMTETDPTAVTMAIALG